MKEENIVGSGDIGMGNRGAMYDKNTLDAYMEMSQQNPLHFAWVKLYENMECILIYRENYFYFLCLNFF
jgi:hypothetical protein